MPDKYPPPIPAADLEGAVVLAGDSYHLNRIVLTAKAVYARSVHGVWIELRPLGNQQSQDNK